MTKEPNRQERKKTQTRGLIFEAAMELFLKQGYDDTTVEQIVAKADVAKGTFFNHFPTKDAILSELGRQRVELAEVLLQKEFSLLSSAQEKIICLLEVFGQVNEENKEITELVLRNTFVQMFSDVEQEKQNQQEFISVIEGLVSEGQVQGEFVNNAEPRHAAEIIAGMYFFTLYQWVQDQLENSLQLELLARTKIILRGIQTRQKIE
ncbi:TetR/AcrR family transcriptional regulator [Desulfosporosinus sp.]|uniref:TetR/AcrR family transcriptional regulator n=1 Tax=Desulfosporosinus sp. TaxID=157907 RepID=UPI0025C26318|nr:TetR/AcrR family transcriptional regulator [Desulfosporosinus sp.]MBC2722856.1 TetR/AcrR family transcriptional regulator [Desulfosporosinus sp.]MBC2725683.1 TetR/AcrR family transcriptional regulator [Desulfosporosinus sp.]